MPVVNRADLELATTGRDRERLQSPAGERLQRNVVEAGPPQRAGRLGEHDLAAGPGLRDGGVDPAVGPATGTACSSAPEASSNRTRAGGCAAAPDAAGVEASTRHSA